MRNPVARGCVVCGAEHPDEHDQPTHDAHDARLRAQALAAAIKDRAELESESELAFAWGDR